MGVFILLKGKQKKIHKVIEISLLNVVGSWELGLSFYDELP
jgi:hypothetical protein